MSTLSMNQVTTYRWSLAQEVQRYCEAGYEGIGVWRQKLADFGEARGIDLIAESGLQVTHLAWAGGFTGSDGRTFDESMTDALEAVQTAAALQAGCLVVYPGGRNNHTYRHAERLLYAALDELLDYAVAADVVLALEPVHRDCADEWSFQTEAAEALALVERFGSSHLKLALDAYNFGDCPEVLANLAELAPHTALVHLADRRERRTIDQSRCPLGAGSIPLANFVSGLVDAGYSGSFDVKIYGPEVTPTDYDMLLASSLATADAWTPVRGS